MTTPLLIGWTTTPDAETARHLAEGAVRAGLAACAQVSGPIESFYLWNGQLEKSQEWRLTLKFAEHSAEELGRWIRQHHPYQTPQWVAVRAELAMPEYADWVMTAGQTSQ